MSEILVVGKKHPAWRCSLGSAPFEAWLPSLRGKPVLLDPPIDASDDQVDGVARAARRAGALLEHGPWEDVTAGEQPTTKRCWHCHHSFLAGDGEELRPRRKPKAVDLISGETMVVDSRRQGQCFYDGGERVEQPSPAVFEEAP